MQGVPISRHEWFRAYFIALESLAISSCLATRDYGGWMVLGTKFQQLGLISAVAFYLLLVSSLIFLFRKGERKLAISGLLVLGLFIALTFVLPMGGVRF